MDSGVAKSCSSWTLECLDHYILRYNPVTPVKSQEDKELHTNYPVLCQSTLPAYSKSCAQYVVLRCFCIVGGRRRVRSGGGLVSAGGRWAALVMSRHCLHCVSVQCLQCPHMARDNYQHLGSSADRTQHSVGIKDNLKMYINERITVVCLYYYFIYNL